MKPVCRPTSHSGRRCARTSSLARALLSKTRGRRPMPIFIRSGRCRAGNGQARSRVLSRGDGEMNGTCRSTLRAFPDLASWQHRGARIGFEVAFFRAQDGGFVVAGCTTAVESDETWAVTYEIALDASSRTRRARVSSLSRRGRLDIEVTSDGGGHWQVDGKPAPHLDGCLDIDLESSALTNSFPVRRLSLRIGEQSDAPAAYVRVAELRVERLDQH